MGNIQRASARTVLYFLFCAFWTGSLHAFPGPQTAPLDVPDKPAANDLPDAGEASNEVRCPDCDDDGKITCPTCAGRKELFKPCELCKGTGRKPCPVCIKPEGGAGAGKLKCDSCGGKGVLGGGVTCPRCGGAQSLDCTNCGARGWQPCKKEVVEKVCPTCRFVGKLSCPTCGGRKLVSKALFEAHQAEIAKSSARKAILPSPQPVVESEPSGAPEASRADPGEPDGSVAQMIPFTEIVSRFATLKNAYDAHLDVFAVDPRAKLDALRGEASKLLKRLPPSQRDDGTTAGKLFVWSQRTLSFRTRWTELRTLFDDEHKTFNPLQKLLGERTSRINGASKGQRTEVERETDRKLSVALRVAERRSQKLSGEDPAWLLREHDEIETSWPALKAQGEAEAAALEQKAVEEAAKSAIAKKSAKEARERAEAAARAHSAPPRKPVEPRTRGSEPSGASPTASLLDTPAETSSPPGEAQFPPRRRREQSPEEPGRFSAMLWAILGAGIASAAFWIVSRSRRSSARSEAPPAVS